MKISEFTQKIQSTIENHNINQEEAEDYAEFSFYGLRFEDKDREIGEELANSRHNSGREDERDFPGFDTEEYGELEELDGTSAYYITERGQFNQSVYKARHQSGDDNLVVMGNHCYIIGGDTTGTHNDPDIDEILIQDAVVVAKLF